MSRNKRSGGQARSTGLFKLAGAIETEGERGVSGSAY